MYGIFLECKRALNVFVPILKKKSITYFMYGNSEEKNENKK